MPPAPKKSSPAAATVIYSLTLLPVKRLGQPEHVLAVVKTVGDKVEAITPLPDGQWESIDGALRDLQRAAVQLFRFKNAEALLAGRV